MSDDGIEYDPETDEFWGLDMSGVVRSAPIRADCWDRIRAANALIASHYAKTGEAMLPNPRAETTAYRLAWAEPITSEV